MKKILILPAAIFLLAFSSKAQDVIVLNNGNVYQGTVTQIRPTEISFVRNDIPDSPLYTSYKNEVNYIIYKNGAKEYFGYNNSTSCHQNSQPNVVVVQTPVAVAPPMPRPYVNIGFGYRGCNNGFRGGYGGGHHGPHRGRW